MTQPISTLANVRPIPALQRQLSYLNRELARVGGRFNFATGGLAVETRLIRHASRVVGPVSAGPQREDAELPLQVRTPALPHQRTLFSKCSTRFGLRPIPVCCQPICRCPASVCFPSTVF